MVYMEKYYKKFVVLYVKKNKLVRSYVMIYIYNFCIKMVEVERLNLQIFQVVLQ